MILLLPDQQHLIYFISQIEFLIFDSILNRFLFPAPPKSYDWGTYPGELLCVVGREGDIVPCLLLPGVSNHTSVGTGPFFAHHSFGNSYDAIIQRIKNAITYNFFFVS